MSIRGSVTLECDRKGCQAEEVIDDFAACDFTPDNRYGGLGLVVKRSVYGWVLDDDGNLHCPQCLQSDHDAREKDAEIRACGGYEAWKAL